MELMSFLQPSNNEIRKSIKGILDSYTNDWDLLAELLQNSVDAINKGTITNPQIKITVNCYQKTIIVEDNGIGIHQNLLPNLLAPFSTTKENDYESVGEKGVGLTFTIFSTNNFEISTCHEGISTNAYINGAKNWLYSDANDDIKLKVNKNPDNTNLKQGTKIKLDQLGDLRLFELNFEQIKFLLRTRTAIGNTKFILNNNFKDIEVYLEYIDLNNEPKSEQIPYRYQILYEGLESRSIIDLEEFKEYASHANITDQEKRNKLRNKVVYCSGTKRGDNGREIRYVSFCTPQRNVFEEASIKQNLIPEDVEQILNWDEKEDYCTYKHGIFTSVKGMPTGISITPPSTGAAGYWSNIFILFEDSSLTFDIGRKSIDGRKTRKLKELSKQIFNDYRKYIAKYMSGDPSFFSEDWDKDIIFSEIEDELLPIKSSITKFIRTPRDQEASVCAIFFELVGQGKFENLDLLAAGYRNKYDLYAKYMKKRIVIEFKSKLKNILKDFLDENKLFNEVDYIVCWDVNEEDKVMLNKKGITINHFEQSEFENNKIIPETTHWLSLSGPTKPIYVIDLKHILSI